MLRSVSKVSLTSKRVIWVSSWVSYPIGLPQADQWLPARRPSEKTSTPYPMGRHRPGQTARSARCILPSGLVAIPVASPPLVISMTRAVIVALIVGLGIVNASMVLLMFVPEGIKNFVCGSQPEIRFC